MMMWGYGPGFHAWGNAGFGWIGLIMMAVHILFWGLLIWFGISFFKKHPHSNRYGHRDTYNRNEALDILRERYARGEIDTEEFRRRKEGLS